MGWLKNTRKSPYATLKQLHRLIFLAVLLHAAARYCTRNNYRQISVVNVQIAGSSKSVFSSSVQCRSRHARFRGIPIMLARAVEKYISTLIVASVSTSSRYFKGAYFANLTCLCGWRWLYNLQAVNHRHSKRHIRARKQKLCQARSRCSSCPFLGMA